MTTKPRRMAGPPPAAQPLTAQAGIPADQTTKYVVLHPDAHSPSWVKPVMAMENSRPASSRASKKYRPKERSQASR